MALLLQAPGPQWGGVWLGSQREGCLTCVLEATCSFEGWRPLGGGTQIIFNLTSMQRGAQPHKSVCELAPGSGALWPARPYLSSRDQRGLFSACLSNMTRVLLFCSKLDTLFGPRVLRSLDSGDRVRTTWGCILTLSHVAGVTLWLL